MSIADAAGIGRNDLAKEPKKKRRTIYEQAIVGDVLVALGIVKVDAKRTKTGTHTETRSAIFALEQVSAEVGGLEIYERWVDQGIIADPKIVVEVWELRPAGHYRKRRAGR